MKVNKLVATSSDGPFIFGGDSAYLTVWPKNPDGKDLLLLFTINCKAANQRLMRADLPSEGFLHVFSTYDPDEYFIDLITADELQQDKTTASYTYVTYADTAHSVRSTRPSIPLRHADFEECVIDDNELSVFSLVARDAPAGALIPEVLSESYNFFCQVYSSDFPAPYQDALYMTDGVGYLLINKNMGNGKSDGCFYVQVA